MRIRDRQDAAAWQTFDEIYRPMLHRYARACGLGDADCEDVVQQCMASLQQSIGSFEYDPGKGRFKAYLRTIVRNRVRNWAVVRRDRQADSAELEQLADDDASPDDVFDRLWMQEHLWHCLRNLRGEVDDTTYRAFQHYVIEEWPVERVCAELNLKPNNLYTIKWRLTDRIAGMMRELLGDDG
jgi:RNA polymerase sigma-70 factor (ECF subfamily)